MAQFISFNEFLDQTAGAKFDHYRETIREGLLHPFAAAGGLLHKARAGLLKSLKKITDDAVDEEFTKMKAHVLSLYKGVKNVSTQNTFVGSGGNLIDCIPMEEQPACLAAKKARHKLKTKASKPTPLAGPKGGGADFGPLAAAALPPLRRGLSDVFGKPMACPEGRIPMRRITIGQMAQLGKFENFFRKYPQPAGRVGAVVAKAKKGSGKKKAATVPPPPFAGTMGRSEIHRHAVCADGNGACTGCSTWLNLWNIDPAPGVFNLSQLWLLGTNSAGRRQTIESGWQRSPQWNPNAPVLFVFHTKDNYDPAKSGYFPSVAGFIQTSADWIISEALPGPFSALNGDQFGFQTQWEIDSQGNWCLYVGSGDQEPDLLGYYPAGFFGGSFSTSAQQAQFGGEVCSHPPQSFGYPSTGAMGSGAPPSGDPTGDYGVVAFQKQIAVQTESGGAMAPASLQVLGADANYAVIPGASSKPSWNSYLFYGGPNG